MSPVSTPTRDAADAPVTPLPAAPRGPFSALRRGVRRYAAALAALLVVALGLGAMWAGGGPDHGHATTTSGAPVPLRTSAPVGDLSGSVMGFQRLRDGHAGVNSPRLPMTGPAMPSATMGKIGGSLNARQEQIAVTLSLRNPSDKAVAYDAGRFLLVRNGQEVPLLRPTRSTLDAGTLAPGSQISGSVFYVVKAGTSPLQLRDATTDTVFVLDPRGKLPPAKPSADGHGDDGH